MRHSTRRVPAIVPSGEATPSAPSKIRRALPVLAGVVVAVLTGCMPPLSDSATQQALDTTPPTLTISSPSDGTSYPSVVMVQGNVNDVTNAGEIGEVRRVEYRFSPDILPPGEATLDGDTFSFSFSTKDFSGNISVELTAYDWNGNTTSTSFVLVDGNPIPSFTVEPTDGGFVASWETVPLTDSYDILYAAGGLVPTEGQPWTTTVADVRSGDTVDGLTPGSLYSVSLRANSSVENSISTAEPVIPQSDYTFTPSIVGSGTKTISWPSAIGWDLYEVQRANAPDGPFVSISGQISGNRFTDTSGGSGLYYYRVRPSLPNGRPSVAVPTRDVTLRSQSTGTTSVVSVPLISTIATVGRYALVNTLDSATNPFVASFRISNPESVIETDRERTATLPAAIAVSQSRYVYGIGTQTDIYAGTFDAISGLLGGDTRYEVSAETSGTIKDLDASGDLAFRAGTFDSNAGALEADLTNLGAAGWYFPRGGDYFAIQEENGYVYAFSDAADDVIFEAGTTGTVYTPDFSIPDTSTINGAVVDSDPNRIVIASWLISGSSVLMQSFDIATAPTNPIQEQGGSFVSLRDYYPYGILPTDITVAPEEAYLLMRDTLAAGDPILPTIARFDFRDPANPEKIGDLRVLSDAPSGIVANADATDTTLLLVVSEEAETLEVVDIGGLPSFGDPQTITAKGTEAIAISGGYAVTLDTTGAGATVRTIDLQSGAMLDSASAPGSVALDIDVHGDLVAANAGDDSLSLLRLDRATGTLTLLGTIDGNHEEVAFRGDSMYVLQGNDGIARYRLSFATPVASWTPVDVTPSTDANDIVFTETHAYVADGGAGVRTFRLLPSGALENLGSTFVIGSLTRIDRSNNKLVATSDDGGVFSIISIADPDNPSAYAADPLFSLPIPESGSTGIVGLTVSGNIVYVAIDEYGLAAVDLKDPTRPVWVSGIAVPGNLGEIVPYRNTALVANGSNGLLQIQVD